MGLDANPIFSRDGALPPIAPVRFGKLGTDNCAIEPQSENSDPSRVKRCLNTHFRQPQPVIGIPISKETAVMRYSVLGNTAVLPHMEN